MTDAWRRWTEWRHVRSDQEGIGILLLLLVFLIFKDCTAVVGNICHLK